MARLICLANSWREGGRCIGGIDYDTGEWVRPVPRESDAIPEARCVVDGRMLEPLNVIDIELDRPKEIPRFQRENQFIKSWKWRRLGQFRRANLLKYCDESVPVLHTSHDRVLPMILERLPPDGWKSLCLVKPRYLKFERNSWEHSRWRARFCDRSKNEYFLRITDPVATHRLEAGGAINPNCALTVSLTRPWVPPDVEQIERCYKLVAAVIEL